MDDFLELTQVKKNWGGHRVGRFFYTLSFVFVLASHVWCAESDSDFNHLGLLEQRDFVEYLRYTFVLGTERQDSGGKIEYTGLRAASLRKVEKLEEALEFASKTSDPRAEQLVEAQAKNIFALDQELIDWSFQFQSQAPKAADYYSKILHSLPASVPHTYTQVLRRLALEVDSKIFALRFPILKNFIPLAGLRGHELNEYLNLTQPGFAAKISPEVLKKIRDNEELNFEEYESYWQAAHSQTSPEQNAEELKDYFYYLVFGTLDLNAPAQSQNWKDFQSRIGRSHERVAALAQAQGLKTQDLQIPENLSRLCFEIYRAALAAHWAPNWELTLNFGEAGLSLSKIGFEWLNEEYASRFPDLFSDESPSRFLWVGYSQYTDLIEQILSRVADSEEKFQFDAASIQIREQEWANLDIDHFAYYKLSPELRHLFCAKIFPDLPVRWAQALLEKKVLELPESDRQELLNAIALDPVFLIQCFDLVRLAVHNADSLDRLHSQIVSKYFDQRLGENSPLTVARKPQLRRLLDGTEVPDMEFAKKQMQRALQDYHRHDRMTAGSSLVDFLTIEVFPYPEVARDESRRFTDQWERLKLKRQLRDQIQKLELQFKKNPDKNQRTAIVEKIKTLLQDFQARNGAGADLDSPAVMMATFLSGLVPRSAGDTLRISKDLGLGLAFFVISKYVGGRIVFLVVASDTGLRIVTAKYFSDHEFNLEKGYSTYLGKWTAEFLMQAKDDLAEIFVPSSAEKKEDALEDFGGLTSDLFWFGMGGRIAGQSVDFTRIERLRKMNSYQAEIDRAEDAIAAHQKSIAELESRTRILEAQAEQIQRSFGPSSKALKSIQDEIAQKKLEITQLKGGALARYQRTLEFYSKRLASEAYRLFTLGISFLTPWDWSRLTDQGMQLKPQKIWERFQRRTYFGIDQFKTRISELEAAIEKLKIEDFAEQARPALRSQAKAFAKALDRFEATQRDIAESLSTSERLLSQAREEFSQSKSSVDSEDLENSALNRLKSSLRKFQKSLSSFNADSADTLDLDESSVAVWKEITRLSSLDPKLNPASQFLEKAEALRNRIRYFNSKPPATIKTLQDASSANRRFMAENFLRLESQNELLLELTKKIQVDLDSGNLPLDDEVLGQLRVIENANVSRGPILNSLQKEFDEAMRSSDHLSQ